MNLHRNWQAGQTGHAAEHNEITARLLDLREFGSIAPDATAALQAGLNEAGSTNGILRLPAAAIRTSSPLTVTGSPRIEGVSRNATSIVNNQSKLFNWAGDNVSIARLTLRSELGGGHIFEQVGTVTRNLFQDIACIQDNDDKSIYSHTVDAGNYLFNTWLVFSARHTYTATVAGFNFVVLSGNGATNFNTWQGFDFTRTGNYGFNFESKRPLNYIYDPVVRDGAWEVPAGGCVRMLGTDNAIIENQSVYDLQIRNATSHLFYLGNGTESTNPAPTRHPKLRDIRLIGSSGFLGAGIQMVYMESGKVFEPTVEFIRTNVTGSLPIDYGNNRVIEIGCNAVTRSNDGQVTQLDAGGLVMRSPNGTLYRVTVANGGALSTVAL